MSIRHPQGNGYDATTQIEEAAQRHGLSLEQFFARAKVFGNALGFNPTAAFEQYVNMPPAARKPPAVVKQFADWLTCTPADRIRKKCPDLVRN